MDAAKNGPFDVGSVHRAIILAYGAFGYAPALDQERIGQSLSQFDVQRADHCPKCTATRVSIVRLTRAELAEYANKPNRPRFKCKRCKEVFRHPSRLKAKTQFKASQTLSRVGSRPPHFTDLDAVSVRASVEQLPANLKAWALFMFGPNPQLHQQVTITNDITDRVDAIITAEEYRVNPLRTANIITKIVEFHMMAWRMGKQDNISSKEISAYTGLNSSNFRKQGSWHTRSQQIGSVCQQIDAEMQNAFLGVDNR